MKKIKFKIMAAGLMILCFISASFGADTTIAILDFELKDLTLVPRIPAEVKRTASIKPLLEKELGTAGYEIVKIDTQSQQDAQSGKGYLFAHHDVAATLAQQFNADYVFVGRLHKPSFLFVYLMGYLIRVSDAKVIAHFISEAKGSSTKLIAKTVENLAIKIDKALDNQYNSP